MAGTGQGWVNRVWYGDSAAYILLLPLSWLYSGIIRLRRLLYRRGVLRTQRLAVPVVVVGNITAGGTGKTPATIWLVRALSRRGFSPGVVSRGYRGTTGSSPVPVTATSDPAVVGDEPVLIAKRCCCPVVVHADRVAAARMLIEQGVDVVVADDGLQHYRLARDVEIAVVDGERGFGSGRMLPSGPLREPVSRLREVDQVLINGGEGEFASIGNAIPVDRFALRATEARPLSNDGAVDLDEMAGATVHAVAAIGHPERFFDMLELRGIDVKRHPLPDHAPIPADLLAFGDDLPVVITEKDAVKCSTPVENVWFVPVDVEMASADWLDRIESAIRREGQR